MGEELKKTGAGNLFTVFGEPDIEIKAEGDELRVELRGVDVYDPTTGEVRSDDTDQIALWMIDTDYNGESFFVRHCYFTGGQDPYERLKKALKADIDEDAWATLYRTESRPFARPEHRQDRRQGDQRLRRRGPEGLRRLSARQRCAQRAQIVRTSQRRHRGPGSARSRALGGAAAASDDRRLGSGDVVGVDGDRVARVAALRSWT